MSVKFEKFENITGIARTLRVPESPCGMPVAVGGGIEIRWLVLCACREVAFDVALPRFVAFVLKGDGQNDPVVSLINRNSTSMMETAKPSFKRGLLKLLPHSLFTLWKALKRRLEELSFAVNLKLRLA